MPPTEYHSYSDLDDEEVEVQLDGEMIENATVTNNGATLLLELGRMRTCIRITAVKQEDGDVRLRFEIGDLLPTSQRRAAEPEATA